NKMMLLGLLSSDSAVEELNNTIDRLKEERLKLLAKHGYTADCLELAYTCVKCSDTGIVSSPSGDRPCACYRQQLIDFIYDRSNLSIVNSEGFASFHADYYPDIQNEERYGIKKSPKRQILGILENCRGFVGQFGSPETRNLLFSGPTGVGKTFM